MQQAEHAPSSAGRLAWLDIVKGLAILWIVYFHFFLAFGIASYPWPISLSNFQSFVSECAPGSFPAQLLCRLEGLIAAVIQRGAQGVGVFIFFSGFGLTYSLVKKGKEPNWPSWYRRRVVRLFPVYWLAHLICLVSPFVILHDPIDYRFVLSLFGDRFFPVDTMFYYLTPAWWFFGLLLQLYIVFPLLYRTMNRLGPAGFLAVCAILAAGSRYLLFEVVKASGNWIMGAFFVCRLWEFAAGMIFGSLLATRPEKTLGWFFSASGFAVGLALYCLGVFSYQPTFTFAFTDGLSGIGLSIILSHLAYWISRIPPAARIVSFVGVYSYGVYLVHQPYVTYAGEKLQGAGIGVFLVLGSAIVTAIVAGAAAVEWSVNKAMEKKG